MEEPTSEPKSRVNFEIVFVLIGIVALFFVLRPDRALVKPAALPAPAVTVTTPGSVVPQGEKVLLTTSDGPLTLLFYPTLAPQHVAQFLRLVKAGIFDGSRLIRNEKGFVVQFGGTFDRPAALTAEQAAVVVKIPAEFSDYKHVRGTLSMARNDDPNSADTSFSVLLGTAPHLDGKYTVFGKITDDSEATLKSLESEAVVPGTTKPARDVLIVKAEVLPN